MAGLGQEDLHWACQEANLAEVRAALKAMRKGGDSIWAGSRLDGATALHYACDPKGAGESRRSAGKAAMQVLQLLLDQPDADQALNARNLFGDTPLMEAARQGVPDPVRLLLEHGAATGEQNNFGDTALHLACRLGNAEAAALLIRHDRGAAMQLRNKLGACPSMAPAVAAAALDEGTLEDEAPRPPVWATQGRLSALSVFL